MTWQNLNNSSCKLQYKERENIVDTLLLFMLAMRNQILIGHVIAQRASVVVLPNYVVNLTIPFIIHQCHFDLKDFKDEFMLETLFYIRCFLLTFLVQPIVISHRNSKRLD
jgi:hypothetical protein